MNKKFVIEYAKIIGISLLIFSASVCSSLVQQALDRIKTETLQVSTTVNDNNCTVIIDAGHGGEDSGAVGLHGSYEKHINLAISKQLDALFSLTDIKSEMTRTDDVLLYKNGEEGRKKRSDILNRVKFADDFKKPVFVSVHQNKFPTEKYNGFQVYYSKNNDNSKILANMLQENVVANLQPQNNRKIKEAGKNILLLNRLNCPAVLAECGFISNSKEELMLNNPVYQKKLSFCMFSSIVSFVENARNERT